ncbi:hypothetical protein D9M72_331250 [compost metagenome]
MFVWAEVVVPLTVTVAKGNVSLFKSLSVITPEIVPLLCAKPRVLSNKVMNNSLIFICVMFKFGAKERSFCKDDVTDLLLLSFKNFTKLLRY